MKRIEIDLMKIAVTGANGFVGKALCQRLLENGHEVTALTRQPCNFIGVTNCVISDYKDPFLEKKLEWHDCVIHLAAKTHSGTKPDKKNLANYRQVNVENTLQLAKAALAAGIKRFIYLSSIKVNGEQTKAIPFTAVDQPNPTDAYGISKWEAEQAIKAYFQDTFMELVIVRPPLIWSPSEPKGNLALLKKWVDMGIPLPLEGWNNRRDIILIDNLLSFLSICIEHPHARGQTFLVSDGLCRSTVEIASLLTRKSPKVINLPTFVYKLLSRLPFTQKLLGNLEVDIDQTYQITGWSPTKTY